MYILKSNIPAQYDIGMAEVGNKPSLLFGTCNPNIVEQMRDLDSESESVKNVIKGFEYFMSKIPKFTSMSRFGDWGFGKMIKPLVIKNARKGWSFWKINIPKVQRGARFDLVHQVAGNLKLLFECTNAELVNHDNEPQLIHITSWGLSSLTNRHHNASEIGAHLSPAMSDWIEKEPGSTFFSVRQNMLDSYKVLFGKQDSNFLDHSDFPISVDSNHLSITAFNMGGIDIGGERSKKSSEGFDLFSHNCTSPPYQLLLLVALATFHDHARLQWMNTT